MSPTAVTRYRSSSRGRKSSRPPARVRRRRLSLVAALGTLVLIGAAFAFGVGPLGDAVREVTLPLRYESIIRQQAAQKELDPALIAAVIYEESKFRDQTSHAGAKGLMQILPSTARLIARKSGGTAFELRDLATPQVNIAYGSFYLRYLRGRFEGDDTVAVAAYNAGEGNVERWVAAAGGVDEFDPQRDIPFAETREYVAGVTHHREQYREHYSDELGL